MHGRDTRRYHQNQGNNNYNNYGYSNGRSGGPARNQTVPNEPPFTAYIGNAPDTMVQGDFEKVLFAGLKVKQVRLVRDKQTDRFRGFAYVDFDDADSLRKAIAMDGTCVNDRAIRIDVAVRPLGAKSEGFRNKSGFQNRDDHQQRPPNNYRHEGRHQRYNYYQQGAQFSSNDRQEENQYDEGSVSYRQRNTSGSTKSTEYTTHLEQTETEHATPTRKISNDDVFVGPDTPATSVDDGTDGVHQDQNDGNMTRQRSRNWADCPIDDSTVETTSPPPSANTTLNNDDFQVVRSKNNKSRPMNSRPVQNSSARGRNSGNYQRGGPSSQMSTGRSFYDQMSPPYQNNNQQHSYYNQNQGSGQGYSNTNPRHPGSAGSRQRNNSNRSHNENLGRPAGRNPTYSSNETEEPLNTSTENRPRLQLLPRTQKISASNDDKQSADNSNRNSSIFGSGKPRDERDPKIMELNKHIEEIVEKEQKVPRTRSTASNGSNDGITKPVRILTAGNKTLPDH